MNSTAPANWAGARGIKVIVIGNGHGDTSSRLIVFHIVLIPLGKLKLLSLLLWVNSRADWDL